VICRDVDARSVGVGPRRACDVHIRVPRCEAEVERADPATRGSWPGRRQAVRFSKPESQQQRIGAPDEGEPRKCQQVPVKVAAPVAVASVLRAAGPSDQGTRGSACKRGLPRVCAPWSARARVSRRRVERSARRRAGVRSSSVGPRRRLCGAPAWCGASAGTRPVGVKASVTEEAAQDVLGWTLYVRESGLGPRHAVPPVSPSAMLARSVVARRQVQASPRV